MPPKVLVTGGAGYIGSHVVKQLGQAGYDVVIYDNLSTGVVHAVRHGELVIGDLADTAKLSQVFAKHQFEAVLHFAASIVVSESVRRPLDYYSNNTVNLLNVLRCCEQYQVNQLIFSSTAAVYGEPKENPVSEKSETNPITPYGASKLMSERIIRDYAKASDLRYVILRYFNVAGADLDGDLGQWTPQATHLIRAACDAALGRAPAMQIFGADFATPDGTGVRDFIHVVDLAAAHLDGLKYLAAGGDSEVLNCGYGKGYSVRQVIDCLQQVSGKTFAVEETDRRTGDPACVIAKASRIRAVLGWEPKYEDLALMIKTSLAWEMQMQAAKRTKKLHADDAALYLQLNHSAARKTV
ncbi:MAG: UDP-glucose 4-epimerase GalE [Cyanobacteria bacterium J06588_5]